MRIVLIEPLVIGKGAQTGRVFRRKEGICNTCGSRLVQHNDNKIKSVINRLIDYKNQAVPLIDYYKELDQLYSDSVEQNISEVHKDICDILGSVKDDCN